MSGETMRVGGVAIEISGDPRKMNHTLDEMDKKSRDAGKKAGQSLASSYEEGFSRLRFAIAGIVTGIVATIARITTSLKQTADRAQSLGVTVEAMSRLEYASRVTGASVQDLNVAMVTLSRRMVERDQLSEGVRIFSALGVSVTDTTGRLKSADRMLAEVADRFARMGDGIQKTELAVRLFGEGGTRLIPLLNRGSQGMRELAQESDNAGNTLSQKSAVAVTKFMEAVDRVTARVMGWAKGVVVDLLPALTFLANDLGTNQKKVQEAERSWSAFNTTMRVILSTATAIQSTLTAVTSVIGGTLGALWNLTKLDFSAAGKSMAEGLAEAVAALEAGEKRIAVVWSTWETTVEHAATAFDKKGKVPIVKSSEEITRALEIIKLTNQHAFEDLMKSDFTPYLAKMALLEEMVRKGQIGFREFSQAIVEVRQQAGADAMREILSVDTAPFAQRVRDLNLLVDQGAISWRDYYAAVKQVTDAQTNAMHDLASTTSQALTTIFEDNKTAAVASAIINTLQGITKALASYPPPYSFAMAALQGAMGFAQVAKIKSTSASGGGSMSAAPAPSSMPRAGAGGGEGTNPGGTLVVQGINPAAMFTGAQMREIAKQMLAYQRDGGKVVLV